MIMKKFKIFHQMLYWKKEKNLKVLPKDILHQIKNN